jgi:TPR repeat protein
MPGRTVDAREKIERLQALIETDDRDAMFEAATAAEIALDARGADAMIGLAPVDPELIARLSELADTALGRAAGLGHPEAAAEVAWRIYCAHQEDRAAEAFELVQHAADLPNGQYLLGLFLYAGFGCDKDDAASLEYHRAAAQAGFGDAMFEMYVYTSRGIAGPVDDAAALAWCRKAAEAGSPRAMANLGGFYATGHGVPRDEALAMEWYQRAAELGHGRAAATLGVMYAAGQGIEPDEELARRWFVAAIDLGYDPTALIVQCGLDPARFLDG